MVSTGFGATIREGREAAGLTHEGLGALVGVDADLVDQWEWEEAVPSAEHRATLATVLRTPSDRLAPRQVVVDILPSRDAPEVDAGAPDPWIGSDPAVQRAVDPLPPVKDQVADAWEGIKRFFRERVHPPEERRPRQATPPGGDIVTVVTIEDGSPGPSASPGAAVPSPPPSETATGATTMPRATGNGRARPPGWTISPAPRQPVGPPPGRFPPAQPPPAPSPPLRPQPQAPPPAPGGRRRWLTFVIMGLAVLLIAAAAGGGTYALIAPERDDLSQRLERAQAELEAAAAEQRAMTMRIGELEAAVAEERLRADRAEETALQELEPVIQENEQLRTENDGLAEENELLRKAIVVSSASDEIDLVALTIDDGGSDAATETVLDTLQAKGVTATLLPAGERVAASPQLWRRAVDDGHELGNHTLSHIGVTELDTEGLQEQLDGWQAAVDEALGEPYATRWFRPPNLDGFTDLRGPEVVRRTLAEWGLITALWDVETFYALYSSSGPQLAGTDPGPDDVASHVVSAAGPGSIVLLHFTPLDVAALPDIIDGLRAKGLEPVSLTQLLEAQHEIAGQEASGDPG